MPEEQTNIWLDTEILFLLLNFLVFILCFLVNPILLLELGEGMMEGGFQKL